MNGSVTPVSGTTLVTPPMMMNACTPMIVVRPVASSFSNGRSATRGDAQPDADHEHVRGEDRRAAEQAELLADRREDEVGFDRGDRVGSPRPSPAPAMPPHAKAKIAWTIWKPLPVRVGPRVAPDRDAVAARARTASTRRYDPSANRTRAERRGTATARSRPRASRRTARRRAATSRGRVSAIMTTSEKPQATSDGPEVARLGQMERARLATSSSPSSSRRSTRYAAKNRASAIFANSPGWKLSGPRLTQILAPLIVAADPGHERHQEQQQPDQPERPLEPLRGRAHDARRRA